MPAKNPGSIAPTTAATTGRWPTAIRGSPAGRGISIGSPSIPTIPTWCTSQHRALPLRRWRQDHLHRSRRARRRRLSPVVDRSQEFLAPGAGHRPGHHRQPEPRTRRGRPGTTSRRRRCITSLPTTSFPTAVYGAQQDSGSIGVDSRTDHGADHGARLVPGGRRRERMAGRSIPPTRTFSTPPELTAASSATTAAPRSARTSRRGRCRASAVKSTRASIAPLDAGAGVVAGGKTRAVPRHAVRDEDHRRRPALGADQSRSDGRAAETRLPPQAVTSYRLRTPKQRGYGVVFSIAPSPLKADEIWAGSDTGLLHLTRDGGKNWRT